MIKYLIPILLAGLSLTACQPQSSPEHASSEVHNLDSTITPDSDIEEFIAPLRDSVEATMQEVIGQNTRIIHPRKPGSPLCNFVADLIREAAENEIDQRAQKPLPVIAVINIRGLRAPLPRGSVEVRDIYALMPFENQMVILTHTGQEIMELFRHMGESNGDGISGASFVYDNGKIKKARIHGEPVSPDAKYYVGTSDYLAEGGDHYNIFAQAEEKYTSPDRIRHLIIEHIRALTRKNQIVNPSDEKRIIIN